MESKFEIIEIYGRSVHAEADFPNKSVFSVNDTQVRFYPVVIEYLQLEKGSEILFSIREKELYVGIVTNHDYKKGYRLSYANCTSGGMKVLIMSSITMIKRGIGKGIYEVTGDVIYDKHSNIEWYKLKLLLSKSKLNKQ